MTMQSEPMRHRIPVQALTVLLPAGGANPAPAIPEVEAALRRRLSAISRTALRAALDCAGDGPVRIVHASRHGEIARSTAIIQNLLGGQEASPMAFSMSVLNAGMGVFSIARRDLSPSTAISAGDATLSMGLLEAATQVLAHPGKPVLFVYSDEPPPDVYQASCHETAGAHACALLLGCSGAGTLAWCVGATDTTREAPSADTFLLVLHDPEGGEWQNSGISWSWEPTR